MFASTTRITAAAASLDRCPQPVRDGLHRVARAVQVECDAAAGEVLRIEDAGEKLGIGHRRLGSTEAVAGGPWVGAGALRPDPERAGGIEVCDGTAARTDLHQIGDRHPNRVSRVEARPFELVLGGYLGQSVLDHTST